MCKYKNMFKSHDEITDESGRKLVSDSEHQSQINWAKTVLQKEDKIIWYLRLYRFLRLMEHKPTYAQAMKMAERWVSVASAVYDIGSIKKLSEICTTLEHYMDLELPEIENLVFGDQSMTKVIESLTKIEGKWKVRQDRKSRELDEYGTPFMTVGKYTWFNLERNMCHLEGKVMAHCGNTGFSRHGAVMYSLREPGDKPGTWIPHVTLILKVNKSKWDAVGATTEIKGRFNKKPDAEFHEALIAFILTDRVTEMLDGGYLAQNNFKITDLSAEKQIELKKVKPMLFSFNEHLNDANGEVTPELTQSINKYGDCIRKDFIELINDENMYGFADKWDMNRLLAYRNIIGGEIDGLEEEELINIRDQVIEHFQQMFQHLPYNLQVSLYFDDSAFSLYISKVDFVKLAVKLPNELVVLPYQGNHTRAFGELVTLVATDIIKQADKNFLLDSYDHLLNSTDLFVLNEGKITDDCYKEVCDTFSKVEVGNKFGPCQPYIEVFDGGLEDFASTFGLETLGRYQETLENGHCDIGEHYFDFDAIEGQVKEVWETKLSQEDKHHLQRLMMDADFIESDDYLLDNDACLVTDSFINLLKVYIEDDVDDEIKDGLKRAHIYADEAGAYTEMYDAAELGVDALATDLESHIVRDGFESIKVNMSLSHYLKLTSENIINDIGLEYFNIELEAFDDALFETTEDFEQHVSANIDMQEPYYGFNDFCSETALHEVERAFDEFIQLTKIPVAA